MNSTAATILLGLVLGSSGSGAWTCYFGFTRPYRRVGNRLVIRLGYLVIGVSSLGTIWLMTEIYEKMGFGSKSQSDVALCAYTVGFAFIGLLNLVSEMKWRKAIGLRGKTLVPTRDKKC